MSPNETLILRAHRILTDGLPHEQSAIMWARGMLLVGELFKNPAQVKRERGTPFTKRELSLGAQEW